MLALAALPALAAEPASPWSGGLDLRLREVAIENANALDDANASASRHFERYRARAWGRYAATDVVAVAGRLMWEGRHYYQPDIASFETWYDGALMFDNLYVDLAKPGGLPVDVRIGRQDVMLGNGWLTGDGTPLDGSRTFYLDAVRATWAKGADKVDVILVNQDAKTSLTLDGEREDQTEQDERGLIAYWRHKAGPATDLDLFYIHKDNSPVAGEAGGGTLRTNNGFIIPVAADPSDDGHVNALGGRIESALTPQWQARAEAALEWGERNGKDQRAFGCNGRLTRRFEGDWAQRVHVGYEYLTGDDPGTATKNEAFDPLWGRWPQWSELYGPYTYGMETRTGETTNLHRLNLGWAAKVHPTTELSLDYHALFADENTKCGSAGFSCSDKFRGHLVTAWVRSKFDKNVAGHLVAEYFFPGDYYVAPKGDEAYFLRAELVLSW
ncbi:MAG: alginate export family protein [Thiobacillus sp.]|nr:alginate export family protein [Thiobacillus sp.]